MGDWKAGLESTAVSLDEAAGEVVAANARLLHYLNGRTEPLTPAEAGELAELEQSAEAWLRTVRRNVLALAARARLGEGGPP